MHPHPSMLSSKNKQSCTSSPAIPLRRWSFPSLPWCRVRGSVDLLPAHRILGRPSWCFGICSQQQMWDFLKKQLLYLLMKESKRMCSGVCDLRPITVMDVTCGEQMSCFVLCLSFFVYIGFMCIGYKMADALKTHKMYGMNINTTNIHLWLSSRCISEGHSCLRLSSAVLLFPDAHKHRHINVHTMTQTQAKADSHLR